MTRSKLRTETPDWKALLADDADLMREIVRAAVTEILEVEMTEALGAERGEEPRRRGPILLGEEEPQEQRQAAQPDEGDDVGQGEQAVCPWLPSGVDPTGEHLFVRRSAVNGGPGWCGDTRIARGHGPEPTERPFVGSAP